MAKSELFYRCSDKYCISNGKEFQVDIDAEGKDIAKCPTCAADAKVLDVQPVKGSGIKKSKPPIIKFAIIGVIAIALIVGAILIFSGGEDKTSAEPPAIEEVQTVEEEVTDPVKTDTKSSSATPEGTQTLTFDGGSKYIGEVKNGKMHGLGTYYYGQKERISKRDLKKRMSEKGDYITGEFYEGKIVSGKLYDSKNNLKEVVMIGR